MIDFAFHIVGIVSFVRAQADKPADKILNFLSKTSAWLPPRLPELIEVILALVGALEHGALVQHVVNKHGLHTHLELPKQLPIAKSELGDDSRPRGGELYEVNDV